MKHIIGIDPGASGGVACLTADGQVISVGKLDQTEADIVLMVQIMASLGPCVAYLEAVHSMPAQGVASSFKFGQSFGFLRGCLAALHIRFELVTPQKWQKAMGCLTGGDKNISKAAAQRLFPDIKMTHALADALLIAEYGRRVEATRIKDNRP